MKKLLSILSVLTISGTSLSITTASSNYEKDNVRIKRQNNNEPITYNVNYSKYWNMWAN